MTHQYDPLTEMMVATLQRELSGDEDYSEELVQLVRAAMIMSTMAYTNPRADKGIYLYFARDSWDSWDLSACELEDLPKDTPPELLAVAQLKNTTIAVRQCGRTDQSAYLEWLCRAWDAGTTQRRVEACGIGNAMKIGVDLALAFAETLAVFGESKQLLHCPDQAGWGEGLDVADMPKDADSPHI